MIVTVFRSPLKPGLRDEYVALVRTWRTNPELNGAAKVLHRVQRAGLHARSRVEVRAAGAGESPDLTAAG